MSSANPIDSSHSLSETIQDPALKGHDYLTYKLDLIKTLGVNAAEPLYRKTCGMRIKELWLLRLIHDYPDITSSEIKVKLVLDKSLLSKHLTDLENRGLIEKHMDTTDNRIQRLRLSPEGSKVWQTCEQIGCELETQMFAGISEEEWVTLHDVLDKLLISLKQWQAKPKPRKLNTEKSAK